MRAVQAESSISHMVGILTQSKWIETGRVAYGKVGRGRVTVGAEVVVLDHFNVHLEKVGLVFTGDPVSVAC